MQMTSRFKPIFLPAVLTTMSAVALVSCERDERPATRPAPTPVKPAPPPLPIAVSPPPAAAPPDGGVAGDAIVPPGEWTENKQYKFRLERIASCGAPAATMGPAQPTAAGASSAFKGETTWVGALFSVQAKDDTVFVSPRDLELRRGGDILAARHINQPLLPGCKPLLPIKQLGVGEDVSGFALFEVPKSFRTTTADPIVLSYKPTRWGGSRRVEVPIRECLDVCPESSASRAGKVAGRSAPVSRPTN